MQVAAYTYKRTEGEGGVALENTSQKVALTKVEKDEILSVSSIYSEYNC
jgi:hypothetical protein